jgi:asparagine synthetase B (glutamine-hydrolysing)
MCGIYGITKHDPELIHKFIQVCKHRGPDAERVQYSHGKHQKETRLYIMARYLTIMN